MSDNFTGRWLVSEYVYNPDGTFVGIIHQHRHLEPRDDGRLRVIQRMQTPPELNDHAMGGFAGEWTFDLIRQGVVRQYHGPDVIGSGMPYGESAIIGQGIWTRFGHNFISFALMPTPQRQITGGKFFNAGHMIANIIGIAYPEVTDAPDHWAEFKGTQFPANIDTQWVGEAALYAVTGKLKIENVVTRTSDDQTVTETYANGQMFMLDHQPSGDGLHDLRGTLTMPGGTAQQPLYGKSKRYGWLQESVLYTPQSTRIDTMEFLDNDSGLLLLLRQWFQRGVLHHVEIITLQPKS